jgi:hypothetical protein
MDIDTIRPATFGEFLRALTLSHGLVDEHGRASPERLSERLIGRGIQATPRGVRAWFNGERAPRIGRMERVLDELGVHGEERLLAYSLAGLVEQDDPPALDETTATAAS